MEFLSLAIMFLKQSKIHRFAIMSLKNQQVSAISDAESALAIICKKHKDLACRFEIQDSKLKMQASKRTTISSRFSIQDPRFKTTTQFTIRDSRFKTNSD
jgi:hypothetical protein